MSSLYSKLPLNLVFSKAGILRALRSRLESGSKGAKEQKLTLIKACRLLRQEECSIKTNSSVAEVDAAYEQLIKDLGADQIPWAVLCFNVSNEPDEIAPVVPVAPQFEAHSIDDFGELNYPGEDSEYSLDDALASSGEENENPYTRRDAYEFFDGDLDGDEEELDQYDEFDMLGFLA